MSAYYAFKNLFHQNSFLFFFLFLSDTFSQNHQFRKQDLNIKLISGEKKGEMLKFQQLKQNHTLHNNFKTLIGKERKRKYWQEDKQLYRNSSHTKVGVVGWDEKTCFIYIRVDMKC